MPWCLLQLTAVDAMRSLVDDWNFSDAQFVEFVGPAMQLLVTILKGSSELDSQTLVSGPGAKTRT